jgi:nicotinate-nucleotide pyrophosphorylase (carboxylating)
MPDDGKVTSDILSDNRVTRLIELALMEDLGTGDVTSESVFGDEDLGFGEFLCKAEGVIAGLGVASAVFGLCDPAVRVVPVCADGSSVGPGQIVAKAHGPVKGLLQGERTALNFLQRMSGIASATRAYARQVEGTRARITDTRKTAPGLRMLDKMAVRLGGGVNHRFGLDDMVLIKDNHIAASGGISLAVERCMRYLRGRELSLRVEVETTSLAEVEEALAAPGVSRIMLDNFTTDMMRSAVELIGGRMEIEASGGITLENVREIALTGVDLISVGALTHSVRALDISLELSHHV